MGEFILPDSVASQLQGLGHPVPLFNPSGEKVGTFVPEIDLSQYEIVGPELTEEQLREIEQSTEWYSTDDVLRHLEKLG
jgi:hypothetical protein